MPNINLDDAYILDETGAQVDKVTGLFTKDEGTTSGEKAFAQLNIGTAGSNRNLLDNPWWGLNEVVNQRGNTSGQTTHNAYSIDRWKMSYGNVLGTWSIAADGMTITAASGTYAVFQQPLANPSALLGKTVTCSILFADGTIASGTVENVTWTGNPVVFAYRYARVQLLNEGVFRVIILNGGSETIRAVKLELGSVSTLANDVPPDYGEELAKCQRYFWRLGNTRFLNICPSAMAEASEACFGICHLPVPMRAMPTISVKGSPVAWTGDGSAMSTTSVTVVRNDSASPTVNPTYVGIRANGGDFTIGRRYDIQIRDDATAYVDFSADL